MNLITKKLKLRRLLILLIIWISVSGFRCGLDSSGTEPPKISIENAKVSRDEVTDLPIVTVDYTVKYPSDLYAQTMPSPPLLICTMEQGQLTRTRALKGKPVTITGMTAKPQKGRAAIEVEDDSRSIGGSFSISCILVGDGNKTVGTSNTLSVNIPPPAQANVPVSTQTPTPTIGSWTLVSVTAIPETPQKGYSYNAQSSSVPLESVHLDVYNGDKHLFEWTKPPAQFDQSGFTVSLNVQCQSASRCASLMGVRSDGLESDTPGSDRIAQANGENGAGGSGQKSVTFKPTLSSPNEIEVEVGLMWGAARFIYKYRRE